MQVDPARTALIIVDAQRAFLEWEAAGLKRNNPQAVSNMAKLLAAFRQNGSAVFHVRHASTETDSALRPERSGYAPIEGLEETDGEPVIVKHVNSAFIGTDLEARLRAGGLKTLVIAGITTNHCVETTTRMAGNLGFDARLVRDACYTFDRVGPDGELHLADDIHRMTLSNLAGEFATIQPTDEILAALHRAAA